MVTQLGWNNEEWRCECRERERARVKPGRVCAWREAGRSSEAKNVGWRRLRRLPSSQMNGVHFNYMNAAPHGAHYKKVRGREGGRGRRKDELKNRKFTMERKPFEKSFMMTVWTDVGSALKLQPLTVKSNIKYILDLIRQSNPGAPLSLRGLININPGRQQRQASIILDRTSCLLHTAPATADHCTEREWINAVYYSTHLYFI